MAVAVSRSQSHRESVGHHQSATSVPNVEETSGTLAKDSGDLERTTDRYLTPTGY